MKKPTVFISSTIHDFRDLRSALKYYLEAQGCIVLASDFNDFKKPLDSHSYDACLESIKQADYFVLLIGGRVGGWYNETGKISITQQEYREAYKCHKQGCLKILTFVRSDVWAVREDRKSLEKHLEHLMLAEENKREILSYQSKIISDAEFISKFIEEVGKNQETKTALKNDAPLPTGNWIHTFHDFKGIIDAIRPHLFSGIPADEAAFRQTLKFELRKILKQCLIKIKDKKVYSPVNVINRIYRQYPITKFDMNAVDKISISADDYDLLLILFIPLAGKDLSPVVLTEALSSPVFLEFDVLLGTYKETEAFKCILLLIEEIRLFKLCDPREILKPMFQQRLAGNPCYMVKPYELIPLMAFALRYANITLLSEALARHLEGHPFKMPELLPQFPIQSMNNEFPVETPSDDEVESFLKEEDNIL